MELFSFSNLDFWCIGITGILFLLLLFYCLALYRLPLKRCRQQDKGAEQSDASFPPVSVIIYAQDDVERIRRHIPAFLQQDYPQFEVIVVGDGISEACVRELSLLKKQYSHLYYTQIPNSARYISKKKLALTLGIKAARYEKMLFTESDSEPVSSHWLRAMVAAYQPDTQMVLGFCSYPHHKGWRNRFIAFDNLTCGLQYLSAGLLKQFYNGTGKNLSYTKALFFANKGFYNQLYLKIGEDSLFVNGVATKENTTVCFSADSLMRMDEIYRLKRWTIERIARAANRKLCTNKFYRIFKIEELLYWLFLFSSFYTIGIGLAGNWLISIVSFCFMVIYFTTKGLLFYRSARLLGQPIPCGNFLILDFTRHFYALYIELISRFNKRRNYVFILEK